MAGSASWRGSSTGYGSRQRPCSTARSRWCATFRIWRSSLWFGIDETAKIFLVSIGVFFPIYINTFYGVRPIDPQLVEMASVYGLDRKALITRIILPGALPSILVGLRYALGFMWLTLIVAETISATSGIGYMTMNAREFLQTDIVLLGIIVYALLGKLADVATRAVERRVLVWHPAYQAGQGGKQ